MSGQHVKEEPGNFTKVGDIVFTTPMTDEEIEHIVKEVNEIKKRGGFDLEAVLSHVLIVGVLLAVLVTVIGVLYYYATYGTLTIDSVVQTSNFAVYFTSALAGIASGSIGPLDIISLGIAILMFTPYVRVLSSLSFFAFKEKNTKYVFFTLWVLVILTFSLFLR